MLGKVPGTTGQYGDLERHPDNQQLPGIVILRVESGLFFANADAVRQRVRAHAAQAGTRVVVLDAETAPPSTSPPSTCSPNSPRAWNARASAAGHRRVGQVRDVVRRVATDTTPEGIYPTVQAAVQPPSNPQIPPAQLGARDASGRLGSPGDWSSLYGQA